MIPKFEFFLSASWEWNCPRAYLDFLGNNFAPWDYWTDWSKQQYCTPTLKISHYGTVYSSIIYGFKLRGKNLEIISKIKSSHFLKWCFMISLKTSFKNPIYIKYKVFDGRFYFSYLPLLSVMPTVPTGTLTPTHIKIFAIGFWPN